MVNFNGKRALVTGAGAGIGRAIALKLAELGAEVFAFSKTQQNLDSLKEENTKIHTTCVDLSDWDATRTATEKVLPIHLLVNNAGINTLESVVDAKPESFDAIYAVNVKSLMNTSQVVAGDLIKRSLKGNFVNISSAAGTKGLENHLIYCSSKAAVNMMTKCFALELGQYGIRVNAISPTVVWTELAKKCWSDPVKRSRLLNVIPMGRFVEVHEVVNGVLYLLSDQSEMVTGHDLPIEGGLLTQ